MAGRQVLDLLAGVRFPYPVLFEIHMNDFTDEQKAAFREQFPNGLGGRGRVAPSIPKGPYCYDETGLCPHWSRKEDENGQVLPHCGRLNLFSNPYNLLGYDKDEPDPRDNLIWDQCKECGINDNWDED